MTVETTVLDWCECCKRGAADFYAAGKLKLYEITEEAYWWGLECVPPAMMYSSAYLCGEPYTDNAEGQPVYSFAVQMKDKFYGGPLLTVAEAKNLTKQELLEAIERGKA